MITLFIFLSLTVSQILGLLVLVKNETLQYFLIYNGLISFLLTSLIFQNITVSQTHYMILSMMLITATSSGIMLRTLKTKT